MERNGCCSGVVRSGCCSDLLLWISSNIPPQTDGRNFLKFGLLLLIINFILFLIATKHRNYNKKVSKQQAYKKRGEIHKRNKDTERSETHKRNESNGFKMGLGL
jgi:hypothetical protein